VKVFVTGARGLVGSELCPLLGKAGFEVMARDLEDADVTRPRSLNASVREAAPGWIVNLAAWTRVDDCETNRDRAFAANAVGAGNVARIAAKLGARLLHVSTDYVFDGTKKAPYREDDAPHPLSVYGESKLAGEKAVAERMPADRLLVVRGQSLYGALGKSFPDAVLERLQSPGPVDVVADQTVAPTWARDFAAGLVALMRREAGGVVHLSASGSCTWFECARAVAELSGAGAARIVPSTAAKVARPAPRPPYSVFSLARFAELTGRRPRPWREQLEGYLRSKARAA
jgi:dTDP-4-dehydrorhamnose reductase